MSTTKREIERQEHNTRAEAKVWADYMKSAGFPTVIKAGGGVWTTISYTLETKVAA